MPLFAKESLETLKQRVDITEVISAYVDLKRAGASYKGLCPFHDEKTPSFQVTKSQGFFHCFGCGAHGDAISFLMQHAKYSFSEAVESLAQRYQVTLTLVENSVDEKDKVDKRALKLALEHAGNVYHTLLLHTEEGHQACKYLYSRGIDPAFIQRFQIGFAHPERQLVQKLLHMQGCQLQHLIEAGILVESSRGGLRDPFADRITFPIRDASGAIIGFSARKYKEETYGGKYVNTSETPLFKKARILFGLDRTRRRIAKERRVVVVEGQLDALRLIHHGLDIVVAAQGTAFGEGHLKELTSLGVREAFLAFDSDKAGREAAFKVGHLFTKEGIDVKVVRLPENADPDSYVRQKGIEALLKQMETANEFLSFMVDHLAPQFDVKTPAGKNALVNEAVSHIRKWEEPILIHESLRRLAHILQIPEEMVGTVGSSVPNIYVKKHASAGLTDFDPDLALECDFLRWLILTGPLKPHFSSQAQANVKPEQLCHPVCKRAYEVYLDHPGCDLLTLAGVLEDAESHTLIHDLTRRKVNLEKADELFRTTLHKILERDWMRQREEVRLKIQSGNCSDEEVLGLLQEFDRLKKSPPQIQESEVLDDNAPHYAL